MEKAQVMNQINEALPSIVDIRKLAALVEADIKGVTSKEGLIDVIAETVVKGKLKVEAYIQEVLGVPEVEETEEQRQKTKTRAASAKEDEKKQSAEGGEQAVAESSEVSEVEDFEMPTQPEEYKARHFVRMFVPDSLENMSQVIQDNNYLTAQQAREYIQQVYYEQNYQIKEVEWLGMINDNEIVGHHIAFVFEKVAEGDEMKQDVLVKLGKVTAYSGFQADAYVSQNIEDGYALKYFKGIGYDKDGVNFLWVMEK